MVVTDKRLRDLGIVDRALAAFDDDDDDDGDGDLEFHDGVEPDPTFDQGAAGTVLARRHGSDAVIELRDTVQIAGRSAALKTEDFDYLINLAVNEAVGYFSPRLLDAQGARDVLVSIQTES